MALERNKTFSVLRTNPKLSGNVKLSVTSDEKLYLDSINATTELADSRYKHKRVNPESSYPQDVHSFFDNGQLASELIYSIWRKSDDVTVKDQFSTQYEQQYSYGASIDRSGFYPEQMSLFSPLWLGSQIPQRFVIFRIPGARSVKYDRNPSKLQIGRRYRVVGEDTLVRYGTTVFEDQETFIANEEDGKVYTIEQGDGFIILDDPEYEFSQVSDPSNFLDNFISPSQIVQVYDLTENSPLGSYLRNLIDSNGYTTHSMFVNFDNGDIRYNGIDLDSGVIATKTEEMGNILTRERDIIDFDRQITEGFERNRLLIPNLINFNFLFDDDQSDQYSLNRYFGVFCSDEDLGRFFVNRKAMFGKDGIYRNNFQDREILPSYYGKNIEDEEGIKVIPRELDSKGHVFHKEKINSTPSFFYIKDKYGNLKKIDNKATEENYVLNDTELDSESLFNFTEDTKLEVDAELLEDRGAAARILTINQELYTGYKLEVFVGNTSRGFAWADHLPNVSDYGEGDNIGYFFYPFGDTEDIAEGLAGAINWILGETTIRAISRDNQVIVFSEVAGRKTNNFSVRIVKDQEEITTDGVFKGGTDATFSRVRVDANTPQQLSEESFLRTENGGFAKIAHIGPYIDEPVRDEEGEVEDFRNVETYKVITLVTDNRTPKVKDGKIQVYNRQRLDIGVLSLFGIKDFDYDFLSSDYRKSYRNELFKYFKSRRLRIKKITIEDADQNFTLSTGTFILKGDFTDEIFANKIIRAVSADGDIDKRYTVQSVSFDGTFTTVEVDDTDTFSDGTLISGDKYTVYRFEQDNEQPIIEHFGIQYTEGDSFWSVAQEFEKIQGNPIVIADRYYNDEELRAFIGFNSISRIQEGDINIDADKPENKFELFAAEEGVTEYTKLRENDKSDNALISRVVPYISKWVLEGGNNIRDVEYKLNLSSAFGDLGFSPSFVDKSQDPLLFTHEWLYLSASPEIISDEEIRENTSYFFKEFDIERLKDVDRDYFERYFTVDRFIRNIEGNKYKSIEVPTQRRFSIFDQVDENTYSTFFRGIRLRLKSEQKDYSGYRFSAVLNIQRTRRFIDEDPFKVELVENEDFRNITLVVTVLIDDYKIKPEPLSDPFGEYLYLYIMNSLKRWIEKNQDYEFGMLFDFVDVFGSTIVDSNGDPVEKFRGFKLPQRVDMEGVTTPQVMRFDNSLFLLQDFLKVNEQGDFGALIGMNDDRVLMATLDDPFSGTDILIDSPVTIKQVGYTREEKVLLENNGLAIMNLPSLSARGNFDPEDVDDNIYPLELLQWFHRTGGEGVYDKVADLLSFGSLFEIINENQKYLNFRTLSGGRERSGADFSLSLQKPSQVGPIEILTPQRNPVDLPEIPEKLLTDYENVELDETKLLFRYNGEYLPKFVDILEFKNDPLIMSWGLYNVTWEEATHTWLEFRDDIIEILWSDIDERWIDYLFTWNDAEIDFNSVNQNTIPLSRRLYDLNTRIDTSIEEAGQIKNLFFHKVSDVDILKAENPVYPEEDEIAIAHRDFNAFLSDLDAQFFMESPDKSTLEPVHGNVDMTDIKSFLGTKLTNIERTVFLLDFEDISEGTDIVREDFEFGGRELVYEFTDDGIVIRIDLSVTLQRYLIERMKQGNFDEFVSEAHVESIDQAIRDYVSTNLVEVYAVDQITPLVKKHNEEGVPLFADEENRLVLLSKGYRENKNFNTTQTGELQLLLRYNTLEEFEYSFAIRVKLVS